MHREPRRAEQFESHAVHSPSGARVGRRRPPAPLVSATDRTGMLMTVWTTAPVYPPTPGRGHAGC